MQVSARSTTSAEEKESGLSSPDSQGELILAVEDEKKPRDFLNIVLGESGYKVLLAADGTEAVKQFTEHTNEVGLVILDMGIPGTNGEEVLSRMIAARPDIRVIAVSGLITPEARSAVMQLGAYDYMLKPYLREELLQMVRETLQSREHAESPAQAVNNP